LNNIGQNSDNSEEIEDFYDDLNSQGEPVKKSMMEDTNGDLAVNDEGELDLDYSQTHLDDFLKS